MQDRHAQREVREPAAILEAIPEKREGELYDQISFASRNGFYHPSVYIGAGAISPWSGVISAPGHTSAAGMIWSK